MNNIVLIGMPGTGKSVVGRALAERLNFTFVDVDDLIIEKAGKKLSQVLREEGLEAFLALEERVGLETEFNHTVIATGGSMVLSAAAMKPGQQMQYIRMVLMVHGRCVYFQTCFLQ